MSIFLQKIQAQRSALVGEQEALLAELDEIATDETRSADEASIQRGEEIVARLEAIKAEDAPLAAREATLLETIERQTNAKRAPIPGVTTGGDPIKGVDPLRLGDADARARAVDFVERAAKSGKFINDDHAENVTKLIQQRGKVGAAVARMAMTTGTDVYERAWSKYMSGDHFGMSQEEREALSRGFDQYSPEEQRAMTSGTGSTGGFLVPVYIDPTLVITGAGAVNPMRQISTVKTIGPAFGGWYGATAGQVTAAWTAEGSAAPDNTPTVAQPNIPVYMAEAFVDVTFQAFEDISDLGGDVLNLFTDAKINLEAVAYQTGSGSSQPTGVVTATTAITASRVSPATGGTYAVADAITLHSALPARFRNTIQDPRSPQRAFLGNIAVLDRTRSLLLAQNSANSAWTDLGAGVPPTLFGDAIYEASSMDSSFTTGQNILLYGDFSRYYIVDRVGFTTEFIPNLFDTSTGRPVAKRGWLSHWRTGANAVDTNAFRVLKL